MGQWRCIHNEVCADQHTCEFGLIPFRVRHKLDLSRLNVLKCTHGCFEAGWIQETQ